MKNHIKAVITAVAILTVAAAMTLECLAFDNTSNTQIMNELQRKADAYYEKVSGATTDAETQTYNALKVYIDRIDALRQITERDTTEEMVLEGKRGEAVGILSWIYFSHCKEIEALSGEDIEAIRAEYERQKEVIDKAEKDFFEGNGVTASYTRLLVEIYTRRIEALRTLDNGNGLVSGIVDRCVRQVQSRCAYSESFGEDAENCRIYYAEVSARVHLQTLRDNAIDELRSAAESVCPDTVFDMSPQGRYSSFFSALNSSSLENEYIDREIGDGEVNSAFNEALYEAILQLLTISEPCGEYKAAYHASLVRTVFERVEAADGEATVPQVTVKDIFSGYSLGLMQAQAKDELSEFADGIGRDSALDIVILEYTGAADRKGIIDNTANKSEVDSELCAAKMRCVWYDTYRMALSDIKGYLGEGSDKAREAKVLYYAVDGKIKAGERPVDGNITEGIATDISEMRGVVDRAEAEKFTLDHKAAIEKTEPDLEDKKLLVDALKDADMLGKGAQSFISDILVALGEKYKGITVREIDSFVTADGAQELRKSATYRLTSLVNALSVKDKSGSVAAEDMMARADIYLEKAKLVKAVLDCYNLDYLEGGSEFFGKETKAIVSDGVGEIIGAADGSEEQKAQSCILKIKRAAVLEDIYTAAKGYEKIGEIPNILSVAITEIEGRTSEDAISSYGRERVAHISEIIRIFELNGAKEDIKNRTDGIKAKIECFKYISADKRTELLSALDKLRSEAEAALSECADGQTVKTTLSDLLVKLSEFEAGADNEELLGCLAFVRAEISKALGKAEYYTEENYLKAQELASAFENELSEVGSIDEYLGILNKALAELCEIEDLLDTAKRESKEALDTLYSALMEKKYCYSAEGLATIEEIYTHSLTELVGLQVLPTEHQKARELAETRMKLMREVRLQVVYTSDGILAANGVPIYPEDYSLSEKGYIGSVLSELGIPSDAQLVIKTAASDGISDIIKKAAKSRSILAGGHVASRDIIKALKNGYVLFGTQISIGNIPTEGGAYRVSILLPDNISSSDILGVVFVRADGSVEFFEAVTDGSLLEFETDHFSNYYVIGRGSIDLLPLIICLSIIVACELCVLALLIIRRRKYKKALYGILPAPFALASAYKPAGGNIIVVALGVVAVGLLASISYLVYLEVKASKRKREGIGDTVKAKEKAVVSVSSDRDVEPSKVCDDTGEKGYEILESVSAEAADSLMSDIEAKKLQMQGNEGYEDTEIYYGDKKAEINIDIISRNFSDGETVTLNSLKEKKLVPQSAGRVKVLGRGVLDKKLRIVAQDFSAAALKMILLTGGEAIVTYSASEEGEKKKIK